MASKGKAVMSGGKDSSGKGQRGQKRKNRDVLQFFEDAAVEFDDDDDSDDFFGDDDDDFLDDCHADPKVNCEPGKFAQTPFLPKEEELSGDELEKMLEERYRSGSGYVRYADDEYDTKRSVDRTFIIPSVVEPTIWKVKCKVGREKHVVFCLMQKYVDLKVLGTKLQIISAFAVEHIKGFVFAEALKLSDVAEACNQLADVYYSLVTQVPTNEVSQLLNVRRRSNEVKEGTWARVKNGIYRGDLAQVVAVNNERKRATVKLIPRIDLQALTEKYGGGAILKRTKSAVPAARLISSSELEEFRPLMQLRRDRDTGNLFEFLDGLMLKDGFLYKKVSFDSLAFWDVNPSEDELQKFTLPIRDDSDSVEWLSQLYGEQKKKCSVKISKGGGKGEGSSGSNEQSSFEVHDLVLFGKRDFGMVIGMEKDENYKVLKDGSEGPLTLTFGQKDLKYVSLEKKFTALDRRMKTISVNDTVRILDGPTKGRQGTVKQIYRGVIFLYDENDLDNAYFCSKSQMSEKVKYQDPACLGKVEGGPSTLEDVPSSPKSPLSPKKPWQMRENNADGDRRDKGAVFSVGQALRIRIGPLKGYLCRVVAVRYSDVTVKLDSQQKVLTVKREHLSEVRGKKPASSMSDDSGFVSSFKPFDLLGAEGSSNDWLQGTSGSATGDGWNVGGPSNERAWPAFPSSDSLLQVGTTATALPGLDDNDSSKEDAWLSKINNNQNSSWVAAGNESTVGNSDQVGVWGTSDGGWGKGSGSGASSSREKAKGTSGDPGGVWKTSESSMSQGKAANMASDLWEEGKKVTNETNSWYNQAAEKPSAETWGEAKHISDPAEDSWGKATGNWGNRNKSSESSGWKSSAAVSQSQAEAGDGDEKNTGWAQAQGQNASGGWKNNSLDENLKGSWATGPVTDVHETWVKTQGPEDIGNNVPSGDPWEKVVDKWVDKASTSRCKEWGSSSGSLACDGKGWDKVSGGWVQSQGESTVAGWGNAGGDISQVKKDSWNNTRSFGADRVSSFDTSDGNDSWGKSNSGIDRGFYGGRGSGGRRGRGRDQCGRGRGRTFDGGQFSSLGKNNQDNYTSGNKGWNGNEGGSSWGNSSAGDGCKSTWEKGKSWNFNEGGDRKGWNHSGEFWKDGGFSSEKISSEAGWNGTSSGSSSWGQKSWEKGKDRATEVASWGKPAESQDKATAMDVDGGLVQRNDRQDKQIGCVSQDSWGKAAGNRSSSFGASQGWKSSTSTQGVQSSEGNAAGKWNKDATSESCGWKKGGDGWQSKSCDGEYGSEGRPWSKSAGNDSCGGSGNFENDEGTGWGRGSSGRGRGGFGRGRDQSSRGCFGRGRDQCSGGGSRSAGRGQFSSWKNDGQGGSSWRNSSGGNDNGSSWSKGWSGGGKREEDKGQTKANEGGSSWGSGSNDLTSRWGKPRGWNEKDRNNDNDGSSGNKTWDSGQGGSSWENLQSGGSRVEGGSAWGNTELDKGQKKPGEGGSSWGGVSIGKKGGWGEDNLVKDGSSAGAGGWGN